MSVAYSEKGQYQAIARVQANGGKSRRGGPLIAGKAGDMFPSLERSAKN